MATGKVHAYGRETCRILPAQRWVGEGLSILDDIMEGFVNVYGYRWRVSNINNSRFYRINNGLY